METKTVNFRQKMIDEISSELKEADSFFLTSFNKLPVSEVEVLRTQLFKQSAKYKIVKNSLGKIAFKDSGYETLAESLSGTCGIILAGDDPISCTKELVKFKKDHEDFNILCGMFNDMVLDADKITALSKIPSREELLAKAMGSMMSPLSNFVRVSKEIIGKFVRVIDAYSKKKES